MRKELFYNPRLLFERLAKWSLECRRLAKLRGTVASRLTTGHIDSLELLELLRPLKPGVIYDIGANVGTWTLLAKAIFPQAEVHAFEPLKIHYEAFKHNTGQLSDVHLHQLALGEASGMATVRVTDFSDASSLLPLSAAGQEQWNIRETAQEQAPISRLDDYQQELSLPFPALCKLDVQGFELNVLKGAVNCLKHTDAVLIEVSFREFYQGQCLFHDVVEFLAEHGFSLHALGHGTALGQPLVQADALFVSEVGRRRLHQ